MKKITLLTLLTVSVFKVFAQDIIIKNDKTEVKAKIEELTETTIKYKKFEMLDGPSYNINKRDVFMIIYKNGTKEYIENQAVPQAVIQNNDRIESPSSAQNQTVNLNKPTNVSVGHEPMEKIRRGYYSFEGNKLKTHSDYTYTFQKYGYDDLVGRYKEGKTIATIGTGAGLVIVVVGLAVNNTGMMIGGLAGSFISSIVSTRTRDNAIKTFNTRAAKKIGYNPNIEIKPFFALNQTGKHVGVSFGF